MLISSATAARRVRKNLVESVRHRISLPEGWKDCPRSRHRVLHSKHSLVEGTAESGANHGARASSVDSAGSTFERASAGA